MTGVSVVVPTYQRPTLLLRCLHGLAKQRLDPTLYEVVVADDAASPDVRRAVETFAQSAPMRVRYVAVHGTHGPAAARNAGWRAAHGDVIAFTDDDCMPEPGWLAAGLAAFTPGVHGVEGRVIVPRPERPTDYEKNSSRLSEGEFVTANCFYRRDALEAVGGFDERFRAAWREDSDLFFTLLERGGSFRRAEGAVVVHPVRPAPWGVCLSEQKKAMWNALLYKKHPALYRERIQAGVPWATYATVAALATALASAARGRSRAATAAASAYVLMSARFCARRLRGTSRAPARVAEMVVTSAVVPLLSAFWRVRGAVRYRVPFL